MIGFITSPALQYWGDPIAWREEARSLLLHGTLSVDPGIAARYGAPGQFFVFNSSERKYYSKYGIVNGLINTIPLYAEYLVGKDIPHAGSPTHVFYLGLFFLLIAVAIAYLLYEITGYYSSNRAARFTYVLLAFYTTYLWNYLRSTTAESTLLLGFIAFCLFYIRFNRRSEPLPERPLGALYGAWVAIAVLTETRFYFLFLMPMFAASLVYFAWRERLSKSAWLSKATRAIIIPSALILIMLGLVNQIKFGSPLLSGYHQWSDAPNPHTVWTVMYDFLFSSQWGFFVCFPPLFLALFGMCRFFRHHRAEAIFFFATFLILLGLLAPLPHYRGEWAYGPRYFVFILPVLSLPALYPLEWAYARGFKLARVAFVAVLVTASAFMIFAQMQINRLSFFFKYEAELCVGNAHSTVADDYFRKTSYAKINWDHIRANGHWERLPYYADLERKLTPEALADWQDQVHSLISQSNLYWFSGAAP
jgi:hypothetical protein